MKFSRSIAWSLLLLFIVTGVFAADLAITQPEKVGMSSQRLERVTVAMKDLVAKGDLSGVVTIVAKDGKIVHFETTGKQDVSTGAPMKKDSIFRIYSMTKPITGVAMMILFEEGKWQLNDPVSKHIPEFANLKVAKINPATGAVTQVPPDHPMTMRELMSHSGGLTYGIFGKTPVDQRYTEEKVMDPKLPLRAMIDKLAKIPLLFQPGERWHYSVSVDVQGYLVEKLSGQTFPEFLKTRIFDPLKMQDTAFFVPQEKLNRFAAFYTLDKERKLVPFASADYSVPPVLPSGGGGLVSTASDYLRFCQMLLNGGELDGSRILSPLTVRLMRSNMLPSAARTMAPGTGFGLDFAVIEDPVAAGGYYGQGTYYWGGYAGTWFWIDPQYKLITVGMVQHRNTAIPMPDLRNISRSLVYQSIMELPKK